MFDSSPFADPNPFPGLSSDDDMSPFQPTIDTFDGFKNNKSRSDNPATSLPLEKLLEQLDLPQSERPRRDMRPQWLRDMIDCVADLFEPLAHAGRVGFDCKPENGRWHVSFYLGAAEHIGGALDGHVEAINFRFDVSAVMKCFERVDSCEWRVFPSPESIGVEDVARKDIPEGLSSLVIDGVVMTETGLAEPVAVEIHSVPPAESSVGLKVFAGGDVSPTN